MKYPVTLIDCEDKVVFNNFEEIQAYFNLYFAAANDGKDFEDEEEIENWIDNSYYLSYAIEEIKEI